MSENKQNDTNMKGRTLATSGKNWELSGETKVVCGSIVRRIRATVDMPHHGVKAGDLGGWVEHDRNLTGDAWVADNAIVFDNAIVEGHALVSGNAYVYRKAKVSGGAKVSGKAIIGGSAQIFGEAEIYGKAEISGYATIYGMARIFDKAQVSGYARISGRAKIHGKAMIKGAPEIYDHSEIYGAAFIEGRPRISGDARIFGGATICSNAHISGNAKIYGDSCIDFAACIFLDADISKQADILGFRAPLSRDSTVTFFRQSGKLAYGLHFVRPHVSIEDFVETVHLANGEGWTWGNLTQDEQKMLKKELFLMADTMQERAKMWERKAKAQ